MAGVITSLPPLVEQPPGNNSSNPAGLPGVTYTAAIPTLPQTWTAIQTFLAGTIVLNGTGGASQVLRQSTLNGPVTVGQLSYTDISGGVPPSVLPPPTPSTLGGVFSKAAVANNFLTQIGTDGVIAAAQPAFTNISGSVAASQMPALTGDITTTAGTVATSIGATKVTSAMLNADVFSTAHTWGGQQSFVAPILGTPASGAATNLTGTAAGLTAGTVTTNANLTGPVTSVGNATTIGANQVSRANLAQGTARSVVGVTGNATANVADIQGTANQALVVNGAGTALAFGAVNLASSAGATGVIQAASFPALTGDVTTVAGALASTIAANAVTNAKMATMAAFTFKGNNTSGTATPTDVDIATLTTKASPAAGDYVILSDQAASGAWKKATVSSVSSAGSVSSLNSLTGALSIVAGINITVTPSGSNITVAALDPNPLTATLGSNVALNNTANFFSGPSVAQGTTGTFLAVGCATVTDSATANATFVIRLWDGTTVINSALITAGIAGSLVNAAVSGMIVNPAGNIRIDVRDASSTNGILSNTASGLGKDTILTVIRLK